MKSILDLMRHGSTNLQGSGQDEMKWGSYELSITNTPGMSLIIDTMLHIPISLFFMFNISKIELKNVS